MKQSAKSTTDDHRPEYDMKSLLKGAVRGKYAKAAQAGTNLVLIDPEIHRHFRTDEEVNTALRLVLELRKIGGARPTAGRLK